LEINEGSETAVTNLPKLPIGIQTFEEIRKNGFLYVDKTKYLVDLIDRGKIYFLARPRRFGKSLTVSTFAALFSGKKELFSGLYAEEFMNRPDYKTYPVVRFDMSDVTAYMGESELRASLLAKVRDNAETFGVRIGDALPGDALSGMLRRVAEKMRSPAALLIDEYDKPVLDNIGDPAALAAARAVMRDFYIRVKSADEYLRFVFMTGISKFSKLGVFSAMNNLLDISSNERYSTMLGYTQREFLNYFDGYIERAAGDLGLGKDALAEKIRDYYDGFSFDGRTSLYNPFSTLCFFTEAKFKNYWFDTATPSFLAEYVKRRDLEAESFRGIETDEDFTSVTEIEDASPESFLYQSGYLSVKDRAYRKLILDYPNMEVLSSVALLFLREKYEVKQAGVATIDTNAAFARGDAETAAKIYNRLLASIPYDIYEREEKKYAFFSKNGESFAVSYAESFYHAVMFAMLWASGIHTVAENHGYWGRSDIEAECGGIRYVIELKAAEGAEASERAAEEGMRQIRAKGYADKYEHAVLISLAVDRITRRLGASRFERF
jgi:hypothetical protein